NDDDKDALRERFEHEIFPTLTPLAFDASHPFPFISNLAINIAVVVRNCQRKDCFARIKVPTPGFPRFFPIRGSDDDRGAAVGSRRTGFVLLEDLISANADLLFPGMEVMSAHPFRVTRDASLDIPTEDEDDLLTAIEEGVESRRVGAPVRLEVDGGMPESVRDMLARKLDLPRYLVFQPMTPLALADFVQLRAIDRPELKDRPFEQCVPSDLDAKADIFAALAKRDRLLFHPYDSLAPVVNLVRQASTDPDVLAIKICLYRIEKRSPLIDALIQARKNGKQVAAVVELKAKFDEENNISYARAMEQEGVHVVYGPPDLKVHAKVCLVVRKEKGDTKRYCHLSTGNYNTVTSRSYADLGYFTVDEGIGTDVSELFNALTGYSERHGYRKLLVAPIGLRSGVLARIEREIDAHRRSGQGHLAFKLNGLLDKEIIKALYRASQAGVRVDLNVRGLCALRPGVKNVSENITVTSIVGRFLEHARIYYFRNGGDTEVLLGSSDLMPRNLDRRVELLFPVQDDAIRRHVIENILMPQLRDNVRARRLLPDGSYRRIKPSEGETVVDSQQAPFAQLADWHEALKAA
ncbi:MAG TPA: polyphosphate kinase 1, partial [Methanomassiliicoccales archaeon]|nr:polyphosphate kinase 1 [Methanomassiliicoccales archaeon]